MDRVKVYVDGFNLYHGLRAKHGRKYLWLDLQELAVRLLKSSQHLVGVEYFTARVRNQPGSEERQSVYLDALAAQCPLVKMVEGRFQEKTHDCWSCGGRWVSAAAPIRGQCHRHHTDPPEVLDLTSRVGAVGTIELHAKPNYTLRASLRPYGPGRCFRTFWRRMLRSTPSW